MQMLILLELVRRVLKISHCGAQLFNLIF